MKLLEGGCRVFSAKEGASQVAGNWTTRSVVSRESGALQITEAVYEYTAGISPASVNPTSEEVLYVIAGEGLCHIDGVPVALERGVAVFVPPGAACSVENPGPAMLRLVSSCCPEDGGRRIVESPARVDTVPTRRLRVHEDEREEIRAGEDRRFRFLVHTDLGCRTVTQFAGWIPPSRAPFHFHTYEECIYILEGRGILHLEGQPAAAEFGPGSSIYLPVGVVHCLENPGPETIRLLGVFYPSGSPGAAYEND